MDVISKIIAWAGLIIGMLYLLFGLTVTMANRGRLKRRLIHPRMDLKSSVNATVRQSLDERQRSFQIVPNRSWSALA